LLLPLTQASAGLRERIDQRDASGFIRLNALRLRLQAKKNTGPGARGQGPEKQQTRSKKRG